MAHNINTNYDEFSKYQLNFGAEETFDLIHEVFKYLNNSKTKKKDKKEKGKQEENSGLKSKYNINNFIMRKVV